MNNLEKSSLINKYIEAYNEFNIEKILSLFSDNIHFQNISNGNVNAELKNRDEFSQFSTQSKSLFSWRKQKIKEIIEEDNRNNFV